MDDKNTDIINIRIMIFTAENILLIGAILIFFSILISKTGYRFGIPTLLLFLLVGMGLVAMAWGYSSVALPTPSSSV